MVKASFTVEATFVVPIIICIIVLTMVESMYMHDIAVQTDKLYLSLSENKSDEEINNSLESQMFILKSQKLIPSKTLTRRKLVWNYTYQIGLFNMKPKGSITVSLSERDEAQQLRLSTAVKEGIGNESE